MRVIYSQAKFGDLFEGYVVKRDGEQVRKNSRDDFGLGREYRFAGLRFAGGKCEYLYVKPSPRVTAEVEPSMCEGSIGSIRLLGVKGKVRSLADDSLMIATVVVAEEVTDIPDDVREFVKSR
jgi:hypothetical protein